MTDINSTRPVSAEQAFNVLQKIALFCGVATVAICTAVAVGTMDMAFTINTSVVLFSFLMLFCVTCIPFGGDNRPSGLAYVAGFLSLSSFIVLFMRELANYGYSLDMEMTIRLAAPLLVGCGLAGFFNFRKATTA